MQTASTLEINPAQHAVDFKLWEAELKPVIEVQQLEVDSLLQKRANCLIGGVAIGTEVKTETVDEYEIESHKIANLAEALELASEGNERAEQMVRSNVTTDYLERAYKSGFISEVTLEKRADGEIIQFGQSIEDVHVNSLRHMSNRKLRERAKIEALNSVRDKYYVNSGLLKNNARVTFSMVHEEMNDAEAEEVGFFTHTRSVSIQLMTEHEDGSLIVQSAFVAGRESLSEDAFDKQTIINLTKQLGVDYSGLTTEEILARPLLVSKTLIPNLATSMVEYFDHAAQEVTGKYKFFGLDSDKVHESSEYIAKEQESKRIALDMQNDISKVIERLKLARPKTPNAATATLAELNDLLLKKRIIKDKTIDARVLGTKAAYFVNHARYLVGAGQYNHQEVILLQRQIEKHGGSSSCPGGSSGEKVSGLSNIFDLANPLEDNQDEESGSKLEDCEFMSKECPKCGAKDVKTECKNGVYYGACGCKSE